MKQRIETKTVRWSKISNKIIVIRKNELTPSVVVKVIIMA